MTNNLQSLLYVGLYHSKKGFEHAPVKEWLDFDYVCINILDIVNEKDQWRKTNLLDKLIHDGFIETKDINGKIHYKVNQKGHDFTSAGGYKKQEEENALDWKIKQETYKKFKFDKWAFFIAILSMLISLFTLLFSIKDLIKIK